MSRAPADDGDGSFASPPCGMHEACDAYMGYMSRAEIIPLVEELLGLARNLADEPPSNVTAELHDRAARWCIMLVVHMVRMNAAASLVPHREMSVTATLERMSGIVRTALPRIRDADLYTDLAEILRAYEDRTGA